MRPIRTATFPPLLALAGCVAGAGPLPAVGCDRAAAVQEIVWEQDCSGCPQGLRLRFGRDGQALLTATGKPRLRTSDLERPAALAPADFERLAQALVAAGLPGLAPAHEEPGIADGRWTRWTLRCGAAEHTVFRRESAGPPALDTLDAIVDTWRRRLWPPP